ncbi:MAG: hypothetical protein A2103_03495 [Gammaproteobacteria bacterium GWF2_41_13]|nr:MAG: hypothetical protein A2103_03495 [Gammaproteobacteria bacterium GWF2_41_13]
MKFKFSFLSGVIFVIAFFSLSAHALTFSLPSGDNAVVGMNQQATVEFNEDVTDIGQKYDVGYLELTDANPHVDFNHLRVGQKLIIPTRFILPNAPRKGIVINVSELRLYYYPPNQSVVITYPVGIGREEAITPLIKTYISDKKEHPEWIPTDQTRQEAMGKGIILPKVVEAGPDNPLGDYAMRMGMRSYLIHGTNDPSGVGIRSSAGCIRMYPEDVKELFPLVPIGMAVNIIDQPYKLGWNRDHLDMEVHIPLEYKNKPVPDTIAPIVDQIKPYIKGSYHAEIDWDRALKVMRGRRGVPEYVGRRDISNVNTAGTIETTSSQTIDQ